MDVAVEEVLRCGCVLRTLYRATRWGLTDARIPTVVLKREMDARCKSHRLIEPRPSDPGPERPAEGVRRVRPR